MEPQGVKSGQHTDINFEFDIYRKLPEGEFERIGETRLAATNKSSLKDGFEFTGLEDIRFDSNLQGQGLGTEIIEAIGSTNKNIAKGKDPLKIYSITKEARPFWEKIGSTDFKPGVSFNYNTGDNLPNAKLFFGQKEIAKASKNKGITALDDTARLKKAKDMGFRTDEPVYHGTHSKDIDAFDDKFIGNRDEGFFGRGHYFTSESGEASYYGPNVGEYYTRGKLLDLSPTKKNSNFEIEDKDYFKFWTKELDKLDMLDEPIKIGLKTLNKIDDYVEKNVEFIGATDSYGKEGIAAYVRHPTNKFDEISEEVERIYSSFGVPDKKTAIKSLKNNIIDQTRRDSDLKKLYPGTDNILYSISDYIRVGGKGADELTQNAKKAGYDGIKVGDETVIFDPKNIRSSGAAFNPKKSDSSKLMAGIALPVAGAGAMSMQEEKNRGLGSIPPRQ